MQKRYDYIIAGAGASGLSLAWHMLHSPIAEKNILIVDADLTPENDKTWCFWYSGTPPYADLIYKKWTTIEIGLSSERIAQSVDEYHYYGLRSVDFKRTVLEAVGAHRNFDLFQGSIKQLSCSPSEEVAVLDTEEQSFEADYIFQSCLEPPGFKEEAIHYPLKQHFLGWELTVDKPVFDDSTCVLMDFDKTFTEGVSFMYMLPWSSKSGLLEYTVFSGQLLEKKAYENKITRYLDNRFGLSPGDYQISRIERGVIPMQDRPVIPWYTSRVLNLGTQGGLTKPSTGYTFSRIQDQARAIVEGLLSHGAPGTPAVSSFRFKAYDLWLLDILYTQPREALNVFHHLFTNNSMDEIFRFLNEDSSPFEDLKIMASVPYLPFLRAIWRSRKRLMEI